MLCLLLTVAFPETVGAQSKHSGPQYKLNLMHIRHKNDKSMQIDVYTKRLSLLQRMLIVL